MHYPTAPLADWPFKLPSDLTQTRVDQLNAQLTALVARAPYGWAHTIDLGSVRVEGLFGDNHLRIAGLLDDWHWWPSSLEGANVADIGCFSGGLTLLMSARGASHVFAVDEIPEHLAQCQWLSETLETTNVTCLETSLYDLPQKIAPASLDLILISGVLYHLSDMLVGLIALQSLLKVDGVLLIESNAVECYEHSYANFGRFYAGMWWQPTALCIHDLCDFAGFRPAESRFYMPGRCLVRAVKPVEHRLPFKRGLNWPFPNRLDERPRSMDPSIMAPAHCVHD